MRLTKLKLMQMQMQFYKGVLPMVWPVLVHYLPNLTYFAFLCNGSMEYNHSILQFGSSKKKSENYSCYGMQQQQFSKKEQHASIDPKLKLGIIK